MAQMVFSWTQRGEICASFYCEPANHVEYCFFKWHTNKIFIIS